MIVHVTNDMIAICDANGCSKEEKSPKRFYYICITGPNLSSHIDEISICDQLVSCNRKKNCKYLVA